MEYKNRAYPRFSACGLNCGLCPRYYTKGGSRCPGCAGEGFSAVHPPCGVLSCAQRRGYEYCFECAEFPCQKYDGADATDSFITHKNQMRDLEEAGRIGMVAYAAVLDEKVKMLERLLRDYDDGRRKSFFCTAVNLLDLEDVQAVVARLDGEIAPGQPAKTKAATAAGLFGQMADERGVCLKLRK